MLAPWSSKSSGRLSASSETSIIPKVSVEYHPYASINLDMTSLGAIELPLACAKALDQEERGRQFWRNGCLPGDPGQAQFQQRKACYDLIAGCLEEFEERAAQQEQQGTPPEQRLNLIAYQIAFDSDDELFHAHLYQWLIGRGLWEDLLDVGPKSNTSVASS